MTVYTSSTLQPFREQVRASNLAPKTVLVYPLERDAAAQLRPR